MDRISPIEIPIKTETVPLQSKVTANKFHEAMKYPLYLAQCFGLFPANVGVSPENTKTKWWDWRTIYSLITGIFIFLTFLQDAYKVSAPDQNIVTTGAIVFSITVAVQFLLMIRLSSQWPKFVEEWLMVEVKIKHYALCGNLRRKLALITTTVMSVATVEHFLINIFRFTTSFENDETILEALEIYFVDRNYPIAFMFTKYALWKGIILEFISFQMAFIWSYGDVLIMLIGESLKYKVKQISIRVEALIKKKVTDENAWRKTRKDYLSVLLLCNKVNERISFLILLSFFNNLYSVLMQMFRCMMFINDNIHRAYIYISFSLVVSRLICVIILGSGSNEEYQNIKMSLNYVSSTAFNKEVERFIGTLSTQELVLSGKNFFSVRRNLILKIAGAIVTYELVLIQFNADLLK